MENNDLVTRLNSLGFPLLQVSQDVDVNMTLADLVKSRDLRFWEGFPVVLAYSADRGMFDYSKTQECLKSSLDKLNLSLLVVMSLALYKFFNLKFSWVKKLFPLLNKKNSKMYDNYLNSFKKDKDFYVQSQMMSSQRVKTTFNNYFQQKQADFKNLLLQKEELGLEYALSQVFSPKQKELFLKKLKNEKLTKTEKEYFSRTVRKKVLALANSELYRLAQKLL